MLHNAVQQLKNSIIFLYKKASFKKSAEVVLTEQHDELKVLGHNFFLQYHLQ